MSINLTDLLGQHLVLLWLILAVLLAALELLRRDQTMARMAVCALLAAVVALIFTHLWWLQLAVFVVVTIVGEVVVHRRRRVPAAVPGTPAQDTPADSV